MRQLIQAAVAAGSVAWSLPLAAGDLEPGFGKAFDRAFEHGSAAPAGIPPPRGAGQASELQPYQQSVTYARQVTGIEIYGDAATWWSQAEGRFARGTTPRTGAVMAFAAHKNLVGGHVAAVSRVIDNRTILLHHANWSPINGRRGQVERSVLAVDASPANDWSQVRVWYQPLGALGPTAWPVQGFIYSGRVLAAARPDRTAPALGRSNTAERFGGAFASTFD